MEDEKLSRVEVLVAEWDFRRYLYPSMLFSFLKELCGVFLRLLRRVRNERQRLLDDPRQVW